MFPRIRPLPILFALSVCPMLAAQTPDANQRPVIHATSREVLLDLVARDKRHHAVTDLRPEEVEVYEDGVRQKILVFRNVQGSEQLQTERSAAKSGSAGVAVHQDLARSLNSLGEINFVSIVFAQIAPLNLEFARQAVLEFLKNDNFPNTYVTVYKLSHTLQIVQVYTSDKDSLVKAVNSAAKGLYSNQGYGVSAEVTGGANAQIQATVANIVASSSSSPSMIVAAQNVALNPLPAIVTDPLWARNAASQDVSLTIGNALLTQSHMQTGLRFADSLANGMDAIDSLRELVRSQEKLPGRKVILYLSDGLTFPVDRRDAVDHMISFANRTGVAFYTIDTRGLTTEDPMMTSLSAVERAGAESSAQRADPANGHNEDDDVGLTTVANTPENLRELAEATGGFAVTNTNEIAVPMQRMMEDIRTHYELAYTPTSTNYDGRFRKIEVKVSRPKVTVQTRKGYFALPELNGEPLQPFEAVALNAINARPAPVEFPYQTSLMKFRPRPDAVEYEVAFEIPLSGLRVVSNPKTGKARIQTSLVALIHDANGDVIGKVSREMAREVDNADLAKLGDDRILYAEPVELPKGHYVVDTAVTDEQAGKTTVKRIAVFVDPGKNLGMSSLEVVQRLEPLAGPRNPLDPLEVENERIVPTLADSVASSKPVDLYFVVYPAQGGADEDVNATLQLFREGKEVVRKPLSLSKPEADGSIPMLVRLSPGPGQCDVLITARQAGLVAQSGLSVKIE
ncbi:MAG: VWA domain-containing protein [Candidatus Sulfotelmatobacter sp.]|jgi:VWFA-related protein